jgi:2-keto-4-pentenoate hydratase/2-oxohepta-3-ene-1,7-dioic acid hydratase in catechol pathway
MRICRFDRGAEHDRLGVVEGDTVFDVTAAIDLLEPVRWPVPMGDRMIAALGRLRPRMEALAAEGAPSFPLDEVHLKAPVANPSKFFCGAGNWPEHKEQMGGLTMHDMGYLYKTTNALAGAGDDLELFAPGRSTLHEAELAIIIGKQGARITRETAMDHVAGYAIGLDMTMAGPENFTHNKCYDGFGIIGPWMVTADEIPDPRELSFRFYVNDELRQADKIERLNFDVQELIVFASSIATLYPGDIIMTGTPIGVAPVVPGDVMRTEFDVIGTMVTKVTGVV